ncbi:MAG: hypothetical protein JW384_03737 [Nitrosomonadaceae bacterium]|nr:hypothetical protein [Nitrosomonadaceae bacterium]
MRQLLSIDTNPKTIKGQKYGFMTGVLYLAPADSASTPELPINVCPMAELAQCKGPCLNSAGRGAFNSVQKARIAKTQRFFTDRVGFMADMVWSVEALIRKAARAGLIPIVRPNGTSDTRWELVPCVRNMGTKKVPNWVKFRNLMEAFPTVQWYDYTKITNRKLVQLRDQRTGKIVSHGWPKNYDLTFSYSGVPEFQPTIAKAQKNPLLKRIAVVFHDRHNLPKTFSINGKHQKCVGGDDSDLRHTDPKGVVVALYAKGRARKDNSGFVVNN